MKEIINSIMLRGLNGRDKARVLYFIVSLVLLTGAGESVLLGAAMVVNFAIGAWQLKKVDTKNVEWLND